MSDPLPSGTVVVLRDADGLELLLLRRRGREGKPGPWVFPGGKVEPPDRHGTENDESAALRAAVRECREESGLALEAASLVPISRWVTPALSPKRFDTWFFAARVDPAAAVEVDGEEMDHHCWLAPGDALRAHREERLRLAPPTFVTVSWLEEFADAGEALRALSSRMPPPFHPRIQRTAEGACMLYPGDAGYETDSVDCEGPRHRLWAVGAGWRYERRGL